MPSIAFDMDDPVEFPLWFKVCVGIIIGVALPLGIFAMVQSGRHTKPNSLTDNSRIEAEYPGAVNQRSGQLDIPRDAGREIVITSGGGQPQEGSPPPPRPETPLSGPNVNPGPSSAPGAGGPQAPYVQPPAGGLQQPGQFQRLGSPPSNGLPPGGATGSGGY